MYYDLETNSNRMTPKNHLAAVANLRVGPNFHESMYYEFETNSNKMTPIIVNYIGTT